jgi:hypothetical protein
MVREFRTPPGFAGLLPTGDKRISVGTNGFAWGAISNCVGIDFGGKHMKSELKNGARKFVAPMLTMLALLVLGFGCNTSKSFPDPLAGWQPASKNPDQAIERDYRAYLQKLPADEKGDIGPVLFFEGKAGQHAVRVEVIVNNSSWIHVLIYDRDDKRINTIKYCQGRYAS